MESKPIKSAVANNKRYNAIASSYAGYSAKKTKTVLTQNLVGALIKEIEPNARVGILNIIIESSNGFNMAKFGSVTLYIGKSTIIFGIRALYI